MEDTSEDQSSYDASLNARLSAYRLDLLKESYISRHSFITWALNGELDIPYLEKLLETVEDREKDVDMHIITLVRLLYLLPNLPGDTKINDGNHGRPALPEYTMNPLTRSGSTSDSADKSNNIPLVDINKVREKLLNTLFYY